MGSVKERGRGIIPITNTIVYIFPICVCTKALYVYKDIIPGEKWSAAII